jgi:hypothetical protein
MFMQASGAMRRGNAKSHLEHLYHGTSFETLAEFIIKRVATKQSTTVSAVGSRDCFVSLVMTADIAMDRAAQEKSGSTAFCLQRRGSSLDSPHASLEAVKVGGDTR